MLPLEYSGPTLHRLEALDANRPLLFGLRQHKNYHFHPPCCTDWYMKYFAVFAANLPNPKLFLCDLCATIRDSLRGLRKFLDAPNPRRRVSNPPHDSRFFFAPFAFFAFFAAILLFGCGYAV